MTVPWPDDVEVPDWIPARVFKGEPPPPMHVGGGGSGRGGFWYRVAEWLHDHPGVRLEFQEVWSNRPYKLRKRFPELTIDSRKHRYIERSEGGGEYKVCDMYMMYDEPKDVCPTCGETDAELLTPCSNAWHVAWRTQT